MGTCVHVLLVPVPSCGPGASRPSLLSPFPHVQCGENDHIQGCSHWTEVRLQKGWRVMGAWITECAVKCCLCAFKIDYRADSTRISSRFTHALFLSWDPLLNTSDTESSGPLGPRGCDRLSDSPCVRARGHLEDRCVERSSAGTGLRLFSRSDQGGGLEREDLRGPGPSCSHHKGFLPHCDFSLLTLTSPSWLRSRPPGPAAHGPAPHFQGHCHRQPSYAVRGSRPLLEGQGSTGIICDALHTRPISSPPTTLFLSFLLCKDSSCRLLSAKHTAEQDRLHADPNWQSQVQSPGPWPPAPSPSFLGKVTDWKLVALSGLCGGGPGETHHVMLQDSLDHGGEHFDDHHGPGPLSAVLGRQQGTVRAEPGGVQLGPPGSPDHGVWGKRGAQLCCLDPLLHTAAWLSVPLVESKRSG